MQSLSLLRLEGILNFEGSGLHLPAFDRWIENSLDGHCAWLLVHYDQDSGRL